MGGNDILMAYEVKFGVGSVEPVGFLTACDEMDFVNPRCEFFNSSKPVAEKSVVAKT